ncbi:MAG TPA: PhzF family phenazine biosynthesis protein [Streptosporangiaceae bacterium]
MRIRIIDAFTDRPFAGNPAGVCLLEGGTWPGEVWMRRVAAELTTRPPSPGRYRTAPAPTGHCAGSLPPRRATCAVTPPWPPPTPCTPTAPCR